MNSHDQAVSFMDLLDLDEEIIDARLKSIMDKEKHSNKNLASAIQLLQYKQLVNVQDNCDCDNEEEWEFAAKLIKELSEETVDNVCLIVAITLGLNSSTLVNKSEHLLQQILSDIDLPDIKDGSDTPEQNNVLMYFKISDSILDTVIKRGEKLNLPFLELPVKNILHSSDEKLKLHFLTSTVPKLFEGIYGYSILDKIWEYIKTLQGDKKEVALNVLSSLSEYYLPVADSSGNMLFESVIIHQFEFWDHIHSGLLSTDPSSRKISVYLAKRALDSVMTLNKSICIKSDSTILFQWDYTNKKSQKLIWDNFFILIDSLEEKQSNIVLPSLQLFGTLKSLGDWLNCAFNIGLKHDNTQVRLKCIQNRLQTKIKSQSEAIVLLEALNDINIYDNPLECEELKKNIQKFISDTDVFIHIFIAIPSIKWSPVPFYHISNVLSETKIKEFITQSNIQISQSVINILKVLCNNKTIRKAVFVNIANFVASNCVGLPWKEILSIFCILQSEIGDGLEETIKPFISDIFISNAEMPTFFEAILESPLHIDLGLLYLQKHPAGVNMFIDLLLNKIKILDQSFSRQYSDKTEHLQDVIYLMHLYVKTKKVNDSLNVLVAGAYKIILHYILSLLSNNTLLTIEEINMISMGFKTMYSTANSTDVLEILLHLYKTSLQFIRDKSSVLESKILSMHLISNLMTNTTFVNNYKQEMLNLNEIITLTQQFENKQSIGRLRNIFYEKSCEIVHCLMKEEYSNVDRKANEITEFIENIIECGGYGCLRLSLNIMNTVLPHLLGDKNIKFDIIQFIDRMWKEIEELKSNSQYNPCIEEFVNLITNDALLKIPMYNNVVILYCNKIIEIGSVKTTPLFYLVRNLNNKDVTPDHGQLIYVLSEILLYAPVPRKDQRIVENLVGLLLHSKNGCHMQNTDVYFDFQVQYLTLLSLTKITNQDILLNIETFIKSRIDNVFKNKQRYHGHSQAHRLLLTALQHLLLISGLKSAEDTDVTIDWCIDLLGRLPHQPSVRTCLEWYIALQFYVKKKCIDQRFVKTITKRLPVTSQFMILYWIVKHKLNEDVCSNEEYDFVMDVLLSHTMGQMFNVRLHAQYLATKLHNNKNDSSKYAYTINVIERTFIESAKDKNFIKLQQDYFTNTFDIVNDFTPSFIYYFLPRYCEINNNEFVDLSFVKNVTNHINSNIRKHELFKNLALKQKSDDEIFNMTISKDTKCKVVEEVEELGTIQKKYVPWKNMSDVNVYESGKKKQSTSELIVVASLIDKLPNLGGMARTSEVFGVKTYVVDSLRHLQDKQFQGLSVSAERWIDVEEVRPGQPLKQYLLQKKREGYSVVAAEQTSTSAKLQSFKFPRKTLLLLGHEKEGIPCDLLPMMDYCVEIPQQGFVRSLNVHVTAAIFVWEYARQNIL